MAATDRWRTRENKKVTNPDRPTMTLFCTDFFSHFLTFDRRKGHIVADVGFNKHLLNMTAFHRQTPETRGSLKSKNSMNID